MIDFYIFIDVGAHYIIAHYAAAAAAGAGAAWHRTSPGLATTHATHKLDSRLHNSLPELCAPSADCLPLLEF